jgi:hypothetical protein
VALSDGGRARDAQERLWRAQADRVAAQARRRGPFCRRAPTTRARTQALACATHRAGFEGRVVQVGSVAVEAERLGPVEGVAPVQVVEGVAPVQVVEGVAPVQVVEGVASVGRTQVFRAVEGVVSVGRTQVFRAVEGVASIGRIQVFRAVEGVASIGRTQVFRVVEGVASIGRIQAFGAVAGIAPIGRVENGAREPRIGCALRRGRSGAPRPRSAGRLGRRGPARR